MKHLFLRFILASGVLLTQANWALAAPDLVLPLNEPPVTNSAVITSGDLDNDGEVDFTYEVSSIADGSGLVYYSVDLFLRYTGHLRFLRRSPMFVDFNQGDVVMPSSQMYTHPLGGNYVTLGAFDSGLFMDSQWHYFDRVKRSPGLFAGGHAFFTNKTEVLIGFRFTQLDAGTAHHGWLKLTRPNTLFITPFDLVSLDWNPLPNEPIRAGLPPEIPLSFAVEEAGFRLTWPLQVAGWILETAERLGPDSEWLPVPDAGAIEVLVPPSDGTRFFRLRRP